MDQTNPVITCFVKGDAVGDVSIIEVAGNDDG